MITSFECKTESITFVYSNSDLRSNSEMRVFLTLNLDGDWRIRDSGSDRSIQNVCMGGGSVSKTFLFII